MMVYSGLLMCVLERGSDEGDFDEEHQHWFHARIDSASSDSPIKLEGIFHGKTGFAEVP